MKDWHAYAIGGALTLVGALLFRPVVSLLVEIALALGIDH